MVSILGVLVALYGQVCAAGCGLVGMAEWALPEVGRRAREEAGSVGAERASAPVWCAALPSVWGMGQNVPAQKTIFL